MAVEVTASWSGGMSVGSIICPSHCSPVHIPAPPTAYLCTHSPAPPTAHLCLQLSLTSPLMSSLYCCRSGLIWGPGTLLPPNHLSAPP